MTFDATRGSAADRTATSRNSRTPALDLDSVYGAGPVRSRSSTTRSDHDQAQARERRPLRGPAAPRGRHGDHRRPAQRREPDHRGAALRLHRASTTRRSTTSARKGRRRRGRRVRGGAPADDLALPVAGRPRVPAADRRPGDGRRRPPPRPALLPPARGAAFMPVEFQTGTYRFGHSMVRPSYRANLAGDNGQPFFALHLRPARRRARPTPTTCEAAPARRGGSSAGRRSSTSATARSSRTSGSTRRSPRRCSTCRSGAIAHATTRPTALPQRNLLRHLTWQLPSGQSVARAIGVTPLAGADLAGARRLGVGFERSTPLWYYVLKEAEVVADGLHLGPVGGRIVAEVLIGLLQTDPGSYLATQPRWRPDAAGQERHVPDDRLPHLRGRRPAVARPVGRRLRVAPSTMRSIGSSRVDTPALPLHALPQRRPRLPLSKGCAPPPTAPARFRHVGSGAAACHASSLTVNSNPIYPELEAPYLALVSQNLRDLALS